MEASLSKELGENAHSMIYLSVCLVTGDCWD